MCPVKLKSLIAALPLASCCTVFAHDYLSQGTQELGLQGFVDFDHRDDYQISLNTSYGYFIRDNWEIGAILDVNATRSTKNFALGADTEYNFSNASNWTPYIGAAAQLATLRIDNDSTALNGQDATAFQFTAKLGLKYFINPHVAISVEVNHALATDDLYQGSDDIKKSLTRLLLGTRFYY